jgi:hypothetical protein
MRQTLEFQAKETRQNHRYFCILQRPIVTMNQQRQQQQHQQHQQQQQQQHAAIDGGRNAFMSIE